MKIELYYYDVIEALQNQINKRLDIELDLDGFKGDRITEIKVVSNYGEVEQNEFREGDSIVFYLN
jgi:hypothetical protein|tara:strand:+ start:746 stop:940 length:195 start_codon:yes stop_codon:yes gene_type:complete